MLFLSTHGRKLPTNTTVSHWLPQCKETQSTLKQKSPEDHTLQRRVWHAGNPNTAITSHSLQCTSQHVLHMKLQLHAHRIQLTHETEVADHLK